MSTYTAPKQPWIIVAKREMMTKLTDKAFWIGTISVLVMMVVAFGISFLLSGGDDVLKVGVVDEAGSEVVAIANQGPAPGPMEAVQISEDELESAVRDGEVAVALVQGEQGWQILVDESHQAAPILAQAIESHTVNSNAESLGIDLDELNQGAQAEVVSVSETDDGTESMAFIIGLVFSILFMISALTYGLQIAQSVVEEKESRIVEILVAAIPVRQLLWGKVVGNSLMALGQLVLLLALAVVATMQTEFADMLPMIVPSMGWFVVFFLFGFAALACLWAATGALATRQQDLSNASMPLTLLITLAYVVGFSVTGRLAEILSYVPILSTIIMPRRLLTGDAGWLDALIALALVGAFMAVTIWFGERIYRRGVMNTSGTLKWSQALKTAE